MTFLVIVVIVLAALILLGRERLRELEGDVRGIRLDIERLRKQFSAQEETLKVMEDRLQKPTAAAGAVPRTASSPQPPPEVPPPELKHEPQITIPLTPAPSPPSPAEPTPAPPPIIAPATPQAPPIRLEVAKVATPPVAAFHAPSPEPIKQATTEMPTPPRFPPPPAPPPPGLKFDFDWESLVGVKMFSWIAGIALALAAILFLRYSIDQGWLSPPVRMAIGLMVAIGLLVVCELKVARNYAVTANAMDGAGIAILYSTFFAAHILWQLIGSLPTFLLMILTTAVAVLLSVRRESVFIALLGLLGGFATPALLSTGEDRPINLFSYLLLLNAGLAWVAYRRNWPILTALTLVFTTLYQWAWVIKFLSTGNLPIAVSIFLIFPIVSFIALKLGRRPTASTEESSIFDQTTWMSALLPLVFAFYFAAAPAFGANYGLLFGFLLCLDIGLLIVALARNIGELHLAGAVSTLAVFAVWLKMSYTDSAWPWILAIVPLFILLYLSAPLLARRFSFELNILGRRAVFAAPLLLFAIPVLIAIEPEAAAPALPFTVLFLLLVFLAWYAIKQEVGAIYFVAVFFALVAETVWSAKYLNPERLLSALAIYGIFGIFYIAIPLLAHRLKKPLQPENFGSVLLLAGIAMLFFLTKGAIVQAALWGMALLLAILVLGLFALSIAGCNPLLAIAGVVLSWLVIGVWWMSANIVAALIPALLVVGGFALLVLGGTYWARRTANLEFDKDWNIGFYFGLTGHVFLLVVAGQHDLTISPWPFLGVLVVLNLALCVTGLYTRKGELPLAALLASSLILLVWEATANASPWPTTAMVFAGGFAVLGIVGWILSERLGIAGESTQGGIFTACAVGPLLGAQAISIVAGGLEGLPDSSFLITAHLLFLVALLAIAWRAKWHWLALVAVFPPAIAFVVRYVGYVQPAPWTEELIFALLIHLIFLAYPLILSRRATQQREPYWAAVLSSVPFFFEARHSMLLGGYADIIGVLPVFQALLMSSLLYRLLRLEPPGRRMLGRLALVAGATLAFVTVAIPMQLEKEWITIGWALEGAALAWLYTRIPHRGLMLSSSGLMAAVFVRLALNEQVFSYWPRSSTPILNWYLYTYLVCAAALLVGSWFFLKTDDKMNPSFPRISHLSAGAAAILLFLLLNIEIADCFSTGPTITFNLFSATLAQDLSYTLGWALFAMALLAIGIWIHSRATRMAAIGLLVATIFKCFLHDLAKLGGLYRVGSFVGLAICLALVALALQKFIFSPSKDSK